MSSLPRSEHPTPQHRRDRWTCLNGHWEFAYDDAEIGLEESWSDGRPLPLTINVPFPYQAPASGIGDPSVHEVVWYAKTLTYDESWRGQDLLLHFGAVDYACAVYVNGQYVGGNRGGHVPFAFDIAPYLHDGDNRIILRVEDRQDPTQPRGKQVASGIPHGIDYTCTTGIWQTVWLEPVPQVRIETFRFTPVLEEEGVEIRVILHGPANGWEIEAEVFDGIDSVAKVRRYSSAATGRLFLRIPDLKTWSAESPHLYGVKLRLLQRGEVLDEVTSYLGMRSVEVRDGKFLLNGKETYMKMALDQGYWPEGLLAAPSDEALRADVLLAKSMGFNGVRKHQKIEDPRFLYWCDVLGLMVWGEMANARAWSPEAEDAFLQEWSRAVQRDYNAPCIVAWVPLNESWGVPLINKGHAGQYAFVERAVRTTRLFDFYRPVIDNDGWDHTDVTDICTIHDYTSSGAEVRERYAETAQGGALPERTWWDGGLTFVEGSGYHGQPVMLTEVGGFLIKPFWLPKEQWDVLYATYGSVDDTDELLAKIEDLMGAIASLPFVSGFCYTQLTDVEQEINGLVTYDRKPKVPIERIREINDSLRRQPSVVPQEL
ncbi:glycoside hydrolase family 2 [bacterium]|nr:MAG: glycoside hydrolase family 2 [bacterium]